MGGKQRPLQRGSFTIGVRNDPSSDSVFITLSLPKVVHVPFLGAATIESIGVAAATCTVTWMVWFGRRTARRLRRLVAEYREGSSSADRRDSPVKAKKWDSKSTTLDDFMNQEIAPARARLRKVEDPDTVEKRIAKRNMIKKEQAKKPKGEKSDRGSSSSFRTLHLALTMHSPFLRTARIEHRNAAEQSNRAEAGEQAEGFPRKGKLVLRGRCRGNARGGR